MFDCLTRWVLQLIQWPMSCSTSQEVWTVRIVLLGVRAPEILLEETFIEPRPRSPALLLTLYVSVELTDWMEQPWTHNCSSAFLQTFWKTTLGLGHHGTIMEPSMYVTWLVALAAVAVLLWLWLLLLCLLWWLLLLVLLLLWLWLWLLLLFLLLLQCLLLLLRGCCCVVAAVVSAVVFVIVLGLGLVLLLLVLVIFFFQRFLVVLLQRIKGKTVLPVIEHRRTPCLPNLWLAGI